MQQRTASGSTSCSPACLFHVRALQLLDNLANEASQRDLAVALFGRAAVAGWQPDGALRAQVRYLIRRARALMVGKAVR